MNTIAGRALSTARESLTDSEPEERRAGAHMTRFLTPYLAIRASSFTLIAGLDLNHQPLGYECPER